MDESRRMRIGMDSFFPFARKSMDESFSSAVVDFSDVFGGPPRSVLTRNFSGDFSRSNTFYDEIFPPQEFGSRPLLSSNSQGRSLPAFRIPAGGDGFYGEVFGLTGEPTGRGQRTKASASSNSSSILTSEEVSPLRPLRATAAPRGGDDVALSPFTSRLRPINVRSRHRTGQPPEVKKHGIPSFGQIRDPLFGHEKTLENEDFNYGCSRGFFAGGDFFRRDSPETISLDPNSFRSIKLSMEDFEPSSPAFSPVSSVCQETEPKERPGGCTTSEEVAELEDEEEDEVMSSYVIEINSDRFERRREGGSDSIDIDEAIAWAKERFLRPDEKEKFIETECQSHKEVSGNLTLNSSYMAEEENNLTGEEEEKPDERMEMEMQDEDIRLWLTGKENNIRLLLSSLHHVLGPNSGWLPISLANLRDGSQVKKAYQKARLCLHPDKLQQRGATPPQKYVAQKVFPVLQDAWAEYTAREGFSN